jgi:hypothetical protein
MVCRPENQFFPDLSKVRACACACVEGGEGEGACVCVSVCVYVHVCVFRCWEQLTVSRPDRLLPHT